MDRITFMGNATADGLDESEDAKKQTEKAFLRQVLGCEALEPAPEPKKTTVTKAQVLNMIRQLMLKKKPGRWMLPVEKFASMSDEDFVDFIMPIAAACAAYKFLKMTGLKGINQKLSVLANFQMAVDANGKSRVTEALLRSIADKAVEDLALKDIMRDA